MTPTEALNKFKKNFETVTYRHSRSEVFRDFIDYVFIMLDVNKKPADFQGLEEKYTDPETGVTFAEMMQLLAIASDDFHDAMGDLFMDLVSNGHNGQFFTPPEVCDVMTSLTMPKDAKDGTTVMDCAAGSGRTLLSAAKLINRNMHFTACDIDLTCVKMSVINFVLNSMVGDVVWINTLTMEHYKTYRISKVMGLNGFYIPYYFAIDENPLVVKKVAEAIKEQKVGQLQMF